MLSFDQPRQEINAVHFDLRCVMEQYWEIGSPVDSFEESIDPFRVQKVGSVGRRTAGC